MDERIKKLRKTLDFTQQEFADKLGTARNNIAGYEIGRRLPSDAVITLMCRTFSVNEDWLRTGEGEMFLESSNDALEMLAAKYNLSRDARALVEEFVNLKPDIQQVFVDYALKVARSIASGEDDSDAVLQPEPPTTPTAPAKTTEPDSEEEYNPDIEAQVERYRQQLILEASAGTSGASTPAKTG